MNVRTFMRRENLRVLKQSPKVPSDFDGWFVVLSVRVSLTEAVAFLDEHGYTTHGFFGYYTGVRDDNWSIYLFAFDSLSAATYFKLRFAEWVA